MERKDFEKYLNNIKFDDKPDYTLRDKLEKRLLSSLAAKPRKKDKSRIVLINRVSKIAAVVCIITAVVIAGSLFLTKKSDTIPIYNGGRFTDELIAVRQMAAAGDVKGLTEVLSEGRFESKIVAANLLAKMGEVPELVEMPALESVSMYAEGDLILDSLTGSLRLRSTKSEDWLEAAKGKIKVHINQDVHEAEKVRIIHNIDEDQEGWERHEKEFADLRKERADLEKELAKLSQNTQEAEVKKLKERLVKYNDLLDLVAQAPRVGPPTPIEMTERTRGMMSRGPKPCGAIFCSASTSAIPTASAPLRLP